MKFGSMHENHDSENVVLSKDSQSLRLETTSSSVVPGTDLKRLKLLIICVRAWKFWEDGDTNLWGGPGAWSLGKF